jgi:hypothetical protein
MSEDNLTEEQRWKDWAANTTDIAEAFAAPNIRSEQCSETSVIAPQAQDDSTQKCYAGRPYPWEEAYAHLV